MHEAPLAELCLSEICQGPIRDGRRTDNSEVTVVKAITLIDLPFAVSKIAPKTMSPKDRDRSSTFLSNPVVKKKK